MSRLVSVHISKSMYVLMSKNDHLWITTLATNRHDCYMQAKTYCRTDDFRKELKQNGYRCTRIRAIVTHPHNIKK